MGAIDLARVTFIKDHGTTDSRLDILARLVVLQVNIFCHRILFQIDDLIFFDNLYILM